MIRLSHLRRQRGVAAVEFAILLLVLMPALTIPIFFGRYFWHYTVAHKAANDAARYLSTVSAREMRNPTLAMAASNLARQIASEELSDLNPGTEPPRVHVLCGVEQECIGVTSGPLPETVTVRVQLDIIDNVFRVVPTGWWGLNITANAKVRYVGY